MSQTTFPERPIDNCYWVAPGKLLAGQYPRNIEEATSAAKMRKILDAGVTAFIDTTEEGEKKPYTHLLPDGVSHERFAIEDVGVPGSPARTKATLDAIDRHIAAGETVYVHCWGGHGRTGVIVGCWLARHGQPGDAALDRLHELWQACLPKALDKPECPQTYSQFAYVRNWRE